MNKKDENRFGQGKQRLLSSISGRLTKYGSLTVLGMLAAVTPHNAHALNLYTGNDGLTINLDTTAEYSNIIRVNSPSAILEGPTNANGNDGDSDFQHGLVDNTFDVLPVFDLKWGSYGVHVSGEAFLDTPYLGTNQNDQAGTFNPFSTVNNQHFTSATRNVNGENATLLDAFAYGSGSFGANDSQELSVKVGRQTLLWGQTLFFTGNGIAAGQAPLDILKAEPLPNAEAQQLFLPFGQVVLTYQPNQILTLQGYYQFEWEHDSFEGVGSYFNSSDLLDKGGQRLVLGGGEFLYRVKSLTPPIQNGQFGLSAQLTLGNYDLGFYGLRYDSKAPELYTSGPQPGGGPGNVGSYYLVYPRDIQIYGASLSTTVGPINVAGEISGRRNMPLVSGLATVTVFPGSANAGAQYAVGSTIAAQTSAIYVSPGIPFDPGGVSVDSEFAMNHVLSLDSGKSLLTPGRDNTAGEFEVVVTPTYYFNWLRNTEVEFPIGLTYGLFGKSEIDGTENHGYGTASFGVTAVYRVTWTAGLTYNDYFGTPNPNLQGDASLEDRGYVSFNIEHTF
jgi:hypothetical protein